jgi:hypothetical protein
MHTGPGLGLRLSPVATGNADRKQRQQKKRRLELGSHNWTSNLVLRGADINKFKCETNNTGYRRGGCLDPEKRSAAASTDDWIRNDTYALHEIKRVISRNIRKGKWEGSVVLQRHLKLKKLA